LGFLLSIPSRMLQAISEYEFLGGEKTFNSF